MDVSVIIVNYNTISPLCDAIDSVLQHTESVSFEIIVIDNASNDNCENIIGEKYGQQVIFKKLSENIGFGRANNEAANFSNGRYLFFLNPDTVLLNNAIMILHRYLDANPGTAITGGNLFDENKCPSYSYRRFLPSVFWEINDLFLAFPEKMFYGKNAFFNRSRKPLKVAYITGADLMISRDTFFKAGCFDPRFFLYFEESDLAKSVSKLGYLIKSVPDAEIIHMEGNSFNSPDLRSSHYFKSKLLYFRKYYSGFKIFILETIIMLTFYSRIFAFSILRKKTKVRFWKSLHAAYRAAEQEM